MGKSVSVSSQIRLKYFLADLPSSQHRAGLVGLILHIRNLAKATKGVMKVALTDQSAVIDLDEQGLRELFDALYEATEELQAVEKPYKGVDPVRVDDKEEVDSKTGKIKRKKLYYYPVVVPKGGYLDRLDPTPKKIHVKLWRDMVWQIMRGVPATRKPFQERAAGREPADAREAWRQLSQSPDKATELPSTYFIGAQATNAEGVSFQDKVKNQFLLHFWTYVAQIYVPEVVDRDGKHTHEGFCLAVPDVSHLDGFCEDFEQVMALRTNALAGYRPRDAIVSAPQEAGLDVIGRVSQIIQESTGKALTRDLLFGVDVLHVMRDGNNVRLLYAGRVEPSARRDQEYASIAKRLRDFWFRRQRILNLLNGANWYHGFDKLLTELPLERGVHSVFFALDARESFRAEQEKHEGELIMGTTSEKVCVESLVLKIIDSYIRRRMKDKYGLEWSKLKTEAEKKDYGDKRESLGSESFYAIRSRSAREDFINYFASTICSVPHWMSEDEYLTITKELYNNTEDIRTLTMLALSARIGRGERKDGIESGGNGQ